MRTSRIPHASDDCHSKREGLRSLGCVVALAPAAACLTPLRKKNFRSRTADRAQPDRRTLLARLSDCCLQWFGIGLS
eukprot:15469084-Alexandrium_andersonii.AAC.3